MKFLPSFFLSLVLSGSAAFGQQPPGPIRNAVRMPSSVVESDRNGSFVVGDVRGSIPNKAILLVKPEYPADARWGGAEGQVRVRVTVDIEGNVSKTELISGPEGLAAASLAAAARSKFRIVRNESGLPTETNGVLVYTFEIRKANWTSIAYALKGLEHLPVSMFPLPPIRKAMEADWDREIGILQRLDEIRRSEEPLQPPTIVRSRPAMSPVVRAGGEVFSRQSRIMGIIAAPPPPGDEQKRLADELIKSLAARSKRNEMDEWRFRVGLGLRESLNIYRNPNRRAEAAALVKNLADAAPASILKEVVAALRELESIFGGGKRTADAMDEIAKLYSRILADG